MATLIPRQGEMDIVQPIIIGAGRGSRLNALTDEQPKCYAPIGNRRILEWLLDALREADDRVEDGKPLR